MANGLETTLQSIRRGGPQIKNTLAGQIGAIRQKRAAAKAEAAQNLRDFLLKQQEAASEARRRSVQSQTDLDEMRRAQAEAQSQRIFSISRGLLTLAEQSPATARERLNKNPKLSSVLNVNPNDPEWREQLEAAHDKWRARATGEIPEAGEELAKAIQVQGGTPEAERLQQEHNVYVPPGQTAEVKFEGDRVVDVNRFGAEVEEPVPGSTEAGKLYAERLNEYVEAGELARQNERDLEAISAAVENGEFITGPLGNFRGAIGGILNLAGLDPESISEIIGNPSKADIIQGSTSQIQMRLADELGRVTNMSLTTVRNAVPGLLKTPEGNRVLINLLKRAIEFKKRRGELAEEYSSYLRQGREVPQGMPTFREAVKKLREQYAGISDEQRKIIEGATEKEGTSWGNPLNPPESPKDLEKGKIYMDNNGNTFKFLGEEDDQFKFQHESGVITYGR